VVVRTCFFVHASVHMHADIVHACSGKLLCTYVRTRSKGGEPERFPGPACTLKQAPLTMIF